MSISVYFQIWRLILKNFAHVFTLEEVTCDMRKCLRHTCVCDVHKADIFTRSIDDMIVILFYGQFLPEWHNSTINILFSLCKWLLFFCSMTGIFYFLVLFKCYETSVVCILRFWMTCAVWSDEIWVFIQHGFHTEESLYLCRNSFLVRNQRAWCTLWKIRIIWLPHFACYLDNTISCRANVFFVL